MQENKFDKKESFWKIRAMGLQVNSNFFIFLWISGKKSWSDVDSKIGMLKSPMDLWLQFFTGEPLRAQIFVSFQTRTFLTLDNKTRHIIIVIRKRNIVTHRQPTQEEGISLSIKG